jgi:putative transposase
MAMLPKDHLVAKYPDLRNPWPVRGIPDLLVMDNGMDLHADAVETMTYEMGIEQQFCGVADPAMKGAIERLFRTLSADLFHQLPGTVFANTAQRRDYPAEKLAALDLETFVRVLVRWIVDVYHVTPHRGLDGRTPLSVWQMEESDRVIEMPAYPEQLDTIVALSATRTVWHYGIEYDNLHYNSTQLQSLNHPTAENVIVGIRSHEHDVGYIHVLDPETEEYFTVPAVDQTYAAGMNRHVHLLVCAEARKRWGDDWRRDQLLDVKSEIQAIVDEAVRSKKMKTRKHAAKLNALDSEAVLGLHQDALEEAAQPIRAPRTRRPKVAATPASSTEEDDLPDLVSTPA